MTVARETDNVSATSCSDKPPKYRSSTICPWRASIADSSVRASSRTTRSRPPGVGRRYLVIEVGAHQGIRALGGAPRARVVHQDPPHHLRGDAVEVAAVLPGDAVLAGQAHERLVDQRRRLQRVIHALVPQVAGGAVPQLVVDQRHQLVAGAHVTAGPGLQQLADRARRSSLMSCLRDGSLYPDGSAVVVP